MTNYYENLDAILSVYRMNYLTARARGDFIEASQILYDRNSAHPPEAFLKDMPPFVLRSSSLKTMLNAQMKAKAYCDHWNPLLESCMALFREQNQEAYNRI